MSKITVPLKTLLAVSEAASTGKYRPALTKLHFKGDAVEATDGFMLIQALLERNSPDEAFISAEAVKRAARIETKPKARRRLFRSSIVQPEAEVENGSITVMGGSVKELDTIEGEHGYPQVDKVIPEVTPDMVKIVINPKYLIKACNAARRLGIEHIELLINPKKDTDALLIRGKTFESDKINFRSVIMSIRV